MLEVQHDRDGIAILTWDLPDKPVNVWTEESTEAFSVRIDSLIADDDVKGVVLASGKSVFHVGAELEMALTLGGLPPQQLFERIMRMHAIFRKIETGGTPFAAAIAGHALGGGFEMALSCHARIVADDTSIQLGLPEAKLGLMPGFGGTQRLARLLPLMDAFPAMAQGKSFRPPQALEKGIVTELVPPDDVLCAAKAWLRANASAAQPWDRKGTKLPSGDVYSPANMQFFAGASAQLRKTTFANYPAPSAILEAIYHGLQMPIDQALKFEALKFVEICRSDVARNMIRTLFFEMNAANNGERRPKSFEPRPVRQLGIVGAGLMGSGIAYVAAAAGIDVVLIDTDLATAEKGIAYGEPLWAKAVGRGRISEDQAEAQRARIKPSSDYETLRNCDLVIEAVFEAKDIKEKVLRSIDAVVSADAVIASNTSTIPISELAAFVKQPERVVGLHFFSPVEKMPLVEIISAQQTREATLAAAFDFVLQIKKTPIDVNDGRGFYTTRVVASYMSEGIALLDEGVPPALIENAGKAAGMPMGPLRLVDMTAIDLAVKIDDQNKADLGEAYCAPPGNSIPRAMVEMGRLGEKSDAGFYDYKNGKAFRLWPELQDRFGADSSLLSLEEVQRRLMCRQAVEMLRCMDEGVVKTPEDADLGSILGWGFAPHTGGIASYVDAIGAKVLLRRAEALSNEAGERFAPPRILKRLAESSDALFSDRL